MVEACRFPACLLPEAAVIGSSSTLDGPQTCTADRTHDTSERRGYRRIETASTSRKRRAVFLLLHRERDRRSAHQHSLPPPASLEGRNDPMRNPRPRHAMQIDC